MQVMSLNLILWFPEFIPRFSHQCGESLVKKKSVVFYLIESVKLSTTYYLWSTTTNTDKVRGENAGH